MNKVVDGTGSQDCCRYVVTVPRVICQYMWTKSEQTLNLPRP
jgi:hypothetical protein